MMVADLISIVGTLLNMIVNIYMLGIARFVIGMALGLNSALVIRSKYHRRSHST